VLSYGFESVLGISKDAFIFVVFRYALRRLSLWYSVKCYNAYLFSIQICVMTFIFAVFRYRLWLSYNVPTMTALICLIIYLLKSHFSTRFGFFFVSHLQEHLIFLTSLVFPRPIQHYISLGYQWLKDVKLSISQSLFRTNTFAFKILLNHYISLSWFWFSCLFRFVT
jgi:hypothetical protein